MWGGIAMGAASLLGGSMANSARSREASRNRRFQESMSSTARQREVEDLEKAGLNRVLAAGSQGASTPTGSMAAQENVMEGASQAFSNSAQAIMNKKKLGSEIDLINAQVEKTKKETKVTSDTGEKTGVQATLWKKLQDVLDFAERKQNAAKKHTDKIMKPKTKKGRDFQKVIKGVIYNRQG